MERIENDTVLILIQIMNGYVIIRQSGLQDKNILPEIERHCIITTKG